jgi:hypothetical protein
MKLRLASALFVAAVLLPSMALSAPSNCALMGNAPDERAVAALQKQTTARVVVTGGQAWDCECGKRRLGGDTQDDSRRLGGNTQDDSRRLGGDTQDDSRRLGGDTQDDTRRFGGDTSTITCAVVAACAGFQVNGTTATIRYFDGQRLQDAANACVP